MAKPSVSLADWRNRIGDALADGQDWRDRARKYLKYLEGHSNAPREGVEVVVNTMYKEVKTKIPTLFAKNPDILTQPKQPNPLSKALAKTARVVLPYYLEELKGKRTINRCLLDTVTCGLGVLKFGYSVEAAQQELSPEEFDGLDDAQKTRVLAFSPNGKDGKPLKYINQVIEREEPWMVRWSPDDFVMDPEASSPDLADASWIAFRKMIGKKQAQKDYPQFSYKDAPVKYTKKGGKARNRGTVDQARLTLWEVHDLVNQEVILYFEELDEKEIRQPWGPTKGFPCLTLFFNEFPDCSLADPDVRFYEPQLKEKNDIRSQQADHRRRYNSQTIIEEGSMTEEMETAVRQNKQGAVIKVHPGKMGAIGAKPIPQVPPDVYIIEGRVDQDLNDLIGFSENQRGMSAGREQTATESSIVESRSRQRNSQPQNVFEDFLEQAVEMIWMILRVKAPQQRIEEILGEPVEWVNVSPEEAAKELTVEIKTNSTLPRMDRQVLIAQNLQVMGILSQAAPVLQAQGQRINLLPILKELVDLMNWRTSADELLPPGMGMPMMGAGGSAIAGANGGSPGTPLATQTPAMIAETNGQHGVTG